MQQTFPAEAIEHVIIERVDGNLTVRGWERGDVSLSQSGRMNEPHAEGNVLMLGRSYGGAAVLI